MPLIDHAPATLRMLFATCAADPTSLLNATQRAAIRQSLTDWQWAPRPDELPETSAVVEDWYAGMKGTRREGVCTLTQEESPCFLN